MFDKVLVANRGEIACRIMTTLRRMGIASLALYTDADAGSRHVQMADEAARIGDGPVVTSYLDAELVLAAALRHGAQALHPGYGFLSENADFAERCDRAGVVWIGPTADQLRRFGDKHEARSLAAELDVPMLAGSGLLRDLDDARSEADRIGYPVMLKATAGGGGIGMQRCVDRAGLDEAFGAVSRLAVQHFGGGGVFIERFVSRARHVEVQVFGDGQTVVALGSRDCSAQRRNQKVIEETPPLGLDPGVLAQMRDAALRLGRAVGYRSAGTVEFVVDDARGDASFLEVNTRLQVEHGVTEAVCGIDLVEWMVLEAGGGLGDLEARAAQAGPEGAAIEVRVYAEDPARADQPSIGTITDVAFPPGARVDTWIEAGTEISPYYDPLLAKVIVRGNDRSAAVAALRAALSATVIAGITTNLEFLRVVTADPRFADGGYPTSFLGTVTFQPAAIEVLEPGMQTTIQDHPGRLGYWAVGVPPSGPMDARSFRLANRLVANDPAAAGLEMTLSGPTLRFRTDAFVALSGAPMSADIDGRQVPWCTPVEVPAGSVLRIGPTTGAGSRAYLAVRGGLDAVPYLGSASTFMLGGFGGTAGRALAGGDVISFGATPPVGPVRVGAALPPALCPELSHDWVLGVAPGPHGAPDFFTEEGISAFYGATWQVHHHSDRTGIRLRGPSPDWARPDGGEAGLHPSNIHDNPYAIGTVDFTGDMPVILGPDGPSLGGFVCPATVVAAERWKLGQLRAGDRVVFRPVDHATALAMTAAQEVEIDTLAPAPEVAQARESCQRAAHVGEGAVLRSVRGRSDEPDLVIRRAGDHYVLVEYGPNVLDLELRMRVNALMEALTHAEVAGIEELAPGIRSLQVRFDPGRIALGELVDLLEGVDAGLPSPDALVVPSRIVHLPLSWDDPSTRLAIERYMQVVRDDAPWCPWNIEFIRRVNGLDSVEDVRRVVFEASYVVLGLGDVYLGAPVATPYDPRHRLVTTKYNPARTWTPENAVGIGGAYMCIYGMEGPGGYQFVGRTLQVWNRYRKTPDFAGEQRWLLRFFDQIRFYPVGADELVDLRHDFAVGRHQILVEPGEISVAGYRRFLADNAATISVSKARQSEAFSAERDRWARSGELDRTSSPPDVPIGPSAARELPDGAMAAMTPVHGVVARVPAVGDVVERDAPLFVVEAMKTETAVRAPCDGVIVDVRCAPGDVVAPGVALVVVMPG
ncbi:MAG: urea carboxylase [Acidimicrobiales bacterium]